MILECENGTLLNTDHVITWEIVYNLYGSGRHQIIAQTKAFEFGQAYSGTGSNEKVVYWGGSEDECKGKLKTLNIILQKHCPHRVLVDIANILADIKEKCINE